MIELSATTFENTPQQMASLIEGVGREAGDIGPALPAVVARFHLQMARRFRDEGKGGPDGEWEALSEAYAAWKEKKYPGAKILHLTGSLEASLTSDGEGSVAEYGPNSVFIGSSVPYAQFHQDGTGKMPRRPPIDPNDRDAAEWTVEVWRSFVNRTSRLGWKGRFAGAMS